MKSFSARLGPPSLVYAKSHSNSLCFHLFVQFIVFFISDFRSLSSPLMKQKFCFQVHVWKLLKC